MTTTTPELSPLILDCPTCALPIRLERRQEQGQCGNCMALWHLYIEAKPTLRVGSMVKDKDRKDVNTGKAFVPPTN